MIKHISIFLFFLFSIKSYTQTGYSVIGTVPTSLNDKEVYFLNTLNPFDIKRQTTKVIDGKFTFAGQVDYPVLVMIGIQDYGVSFLLENSNILIQIDPNSSKHKPNLLVEGSRSQVEYEEYLKQRDAIESRMLEINDLYVAAKEQGDTLLAKKFLAEYSYNRSFLKSYLKSNPNSFTSAYILSQESHKLSRNDLIEVLRGFDDKLNKTEYVQNVMGNNGISWDIFGTIDTETKQTLDIIYQSTCNCISNNVIADNLKIVEKRVLACLEKSLNQNLDFLFKEFKKLKKSNKELKASDHLKYYESQLFHYLSNNCDSYNDYIQELEEEFVKKMTDN